MVNDAITISIVSGKNFINSVSSEIDLEIIIGMRTPSPRTITT